MELLKRLTLFTEGIVDKIISDIKKQMIKMSKADLQKYIDGIEKSKKDKMGQELYLHAKKIMEKK